MSNTPLESLRPAAIEQSGIHEHLLADVLRTSGDTTVVNGSLQSVNVDRQTTGDGSVTRFPNGVKVITSKDSAEELVPPPGGKISTDGKGNTTVQDSHGKTVAEMDKDKTVHIHTKNGEYTESPKGDVTFKPSGHTSDLRTLHKPGSIPQSKFEDYGMSTDGTVTRFPNGIEYNPKTGGVSVPAEYPNFREVPQTDKSGQVIAKQGFDGNGKLLYTVDSTGIHVPTSDGSLNEGPNGGVTFKGNETSASKALPKVHIMDPLDPNSECYNSKDPICGLDLGKF